MMIHLIVHAIDQEFNYESDELLNYLEPCGLSLDFFKFLDVIRKYSTVLLLFLLFLENS
jgi:hypothetical protein